MSRPPLDDLPILHELGEDLKQAFRTRAADSTARARGPRDRPRWVLVAASAAAALGAMTAFIVGLQGGSPVPPSAVGALIRAATIANGHPAPFPGDNQFYYVHGVTTGFRVITRKPETPATFGQIASAPKVQATIESWQWFSATRPGVSTVRVRSLTFRKVADRRLWERLGRPSFAPAATAAATIVQPTKDHYLLGNLELTRHQLLSMSTDPRMLYARLYAAGGSSYEVFVEIGDTLRNRPAPPKLRAALYRTLALVPGVRLVGSVKDSIGRRGTAVGFVHDGIEDELIFDPTSSEMLAERTIVRAGDAGRLGLPAGTVLSVTTYLQRAVTDTVTAPAGP